MEETALAFPPSSKEQFLASVKLFEEKAKIALAPLLQEAKEYVATVTLYTVTSQEDLDLLNETTKEVKRKFKDIEESRTSITQPVNEGLRRINASFKPLTDTYKNCEALLKQKVAAGLRFLKEEQTRKLQEVAVLSQAGDMVGAKAVLLSTPDAALPTGTSIREIWKYKITNISLVEEQFLMLVVNDDAVCTAVKNGLRQTPGLEIYSEDSVTTRTQ